MDRIANDDPPHRPSSPTPSLFFRSKGSVSESVIIDEMVKASSQIYPGGFRLCGVVWGVGVVANYKKITGFITINLSLYIAIYLVIECNSSSSRTPHHHYITNTTITTHKHHHHQNTNTITTTQTPPPSQNHHKHKHHTSVKTAPVKL